MAEDPRNVIHDIILTSLAGPFTCISDETDAKIFEAADRILASLPAQVGEAVFGITGASNETEALAIALWAHRCPGIVMLDDDLPYYEAAAKAAFDTLDGFAHPVPEQGGETIEQAYRRGWNDRESDLLVGAERVAPLPEQEAV